MLSGPLCPQFLCTVTAIVLHYAYMSTFAWTFVESLHVYRMLTEVRNIDAGPMRFYYVVGWGIPAIVTGESTRSSPAGTWAKNRSPLGDAPDINDTGTHVSSGSTPRHGHLCLLSPAWPGPGMAGSNSAHCTHEWSSSSHCGDASPVRCELHESWARVCSGFCPRHLADKNSMSAHSVDGLGWWMDGRMDG